MTKWNTELPTQLVVGWTRAEKVTDDRIDELVRDIWLLTADDDPVPLEELRQTIRKWLAKL